MTILLSRHFACSTDSGTLCLTAADSGEVKVRNQEIKTEITEIEDQHVQSGGRALQQGMVNTKATNSMTMLNNNVMAKPKVSFAHLDVKI